MTERREWSRRPGGIVDNVEFTAQYPSGNFGTNYVFQWRCSHNGLHLGAMVNMRLEQEKN